jgi:membrane associated rhomboid family serine protease
MTEPETPHVPVAAPPDPIAAFRALLYRATPRVWVTWLLIAANVAIFVAMVATGVHPMTPTTDSLIQWGADYGPKTTSGQWWRLGSSMFLHIGVIHIAMNMLVLFQVGPFVERLYGNANFLIAYLLAGLFGSVTSTAINPYVVSAGASGAVFGAYGLLVAYLVRCKGSVPADASSKLLRSAGSFLAINLFYGLSRAGIDMGAHIGGLVAGFLLGLALAQPLDAASAARMRRGLVVAAGGLGLVALLCVALPRSVDFQADVIDVESRVLDKYNGAVKGKITDEEWVKVLDTEILPEWRACRARLDGLSLHGSAKTLRGRFSRYMATRQEGWELMLAGIKANDVEKVKAGSAKVNQAAEQLKADVTKDE